MSMTLEQFGQTIKQKHPEYNDLSDIDVGQRVLAKYPQYSDMVVPSVKQEPKSLFGKALDVVGSVPSAIENFSIGAAKGVINAPRLAAEGGAKLGTFLNGLAFNKPNATTPQAIQQGTKPVPRFQPIGTAQNVGYGAEKVAELFAPGLQEEAGAGLASGLASKAPQFIQKAAPIFGKIGAAGLDLGAKTIVQGGDVKEAGQNAALGAGGSAVGQLFGAAGKYASKPLQKSAEKSYAQALGATTKENKAITQKIVPELIDKKIGAFSREGLLSKITNKVGEAGSAIDDVLSTIPKDHPVNLSSVVNDLERAKQSFMVKGANGNMVIANPQAVQHIEGFQNIIKEIGTESAPYESVRALRQIWDKSIAQSKGFYGKTAAEGSLLDANKEAANALRRELAKEFPDMDKVNKDYHFWSNARKVLADTIERTQSQGRPLTQTIHRAAGAVIGSSVGGGFGAVAGDIAMAGLSKLVDSTAWRTLGSIQKSQIASLLAAGKIEKLSGYLAKIGASGNVERD